VLSGRRIAAEGIDGDGSVVAGQKWTWPLVHRVSIGRRLLRNEINKQDNGAKK
jgi:hypothetical protein